ncbi:MAG: hypothetical protein II826_03140 [Prevotella sp.]|nr:hypothetical protein [Prevotella sp.]
MKKTYISPNTLTYAIAMQHTLLAGSGEKGTSVKDTEADASKDVLSRRNFNAWGDDDEEEY